MSNKQYRYIDLKINGRLFPSFLMSNFKKYKLPEIMQKGDEDPCQVTTKKELRLYQLFLAKYLDYLSPYRDILLYYSTGSGKSGTVINIYNALYNYNPQINLFILIKASLRATWLHELKEWLAKDEEEFRMKNIIFVHYDSPTADKQFLEAIKGADSSKKSMYIIDEAHNFIRNVYSNINSKQGKRAQVIYDYIIQDKRENEGVRVIMMSATPAINTPYELALLFNLLRPGIFPKSEAQFNHLYISTSSHQSMNETYKNMFQRRILSLVAFYIGSSPTLYARKTLHYVDVPMSTYQTDIYTFYEEIEELMAKKKRQRRGSGGQDIYKSYTRQASNFVFPPISQHVTGESRPRPNAYRVSERDAEKIVEGKQKLKLEKNTEKYLNVQKYMQAIENFITGFENYLEEKKDADNRNGYTLLDDVKKYHEIYKDDYNEFRDKEKKKSSLYEAMVMCSAKMVNIIFNILKSAGPVLVYSNYVKMEGFEVFKIYLKHFGFAHYKDPNGVKGFKYAEFHGGIDVKDRVEAVQTETKIENKFGDDIKIILISPAGTEGISLSNIRQVHIMEPYWNLVRITQMIGRAIRQCSHKHLPMEDRHVDVYFYKSVRTNSDKWTTDQYIENIARSKDAVIQSFLDAMKEVAVDCSLNKNHNMLVEQYKCFQFDEPSLFDKQIGPAYKEDIYDDMKIDNGSNSTKSITIKVKVVKVSAVKQLTPEDDQGNATYSNPSVYWYNPETGIVYDFDLYYAVGKVSFDEDNLPKKLDKDTYIIDQVIPIPIIGNE
ncbi:MAG: DEAD/SNF2-like helicase [Edafosvirus sp.]|uniref:DEAD/SNF2-like helicase n=1 Tax=Edafosvirus sp. TaxID=2487765 RepID=A0A3G4ZXZ5_9VIRU|nr:MAG: DEAD/SNF2-like helicase [Edafosvirus sp.]